MDIDQLQQDGAQNTQRMTRDPVAALIPCGGCGQHMQPQEWHTYMHCALHKAGVKPTDYGIVLVNAEGLEAAIDSIDSTMIEDVLHGADAGKIAAAILAAIQEQDR